jgi:hypothetical protein
MTESERILERQAAWQKARQAVPWPEKIRQVELMRSSIEALRKQRQQRPAPKTSAPVHDGSAITS